MCPDLGEHILDVGADRADRDVHGERHLPGALPARNAGDDLLLPRRQLVQRIPGLRADPAASPDARQARVQHIPSGCDHVQRGGDLVDGLVLAHEARHAAAYHLGQRFGVGDTRKQQHPGARVPLTDGARGIEAAQLIAELQLKQADVGSATIDRINAVGRCRGDRQHLMPPRREGSRQRLGQHSLIVADDKFHLPLPPQDASRAGANEIPPQKAVPVPPTERVFDALLGGATLSPNLLFRLVSGLSCFSGKFNC